MFIKESPVYTNIKKHIPMKFPTKLLVFSIDSLVCYASAYAMVCVQKMIDTVTDAGTVDLPIFYQTLYLTIGVILVYVISSNIGSIISFFMGLDFTKNVTKYLFTSYYKQNVAFSKETDSGEVASKFMNDAESVAGWLASGDLSFYESLTNFLIRFCILWSYYPPISITIVVVMSICFGCTRKINKIKAEYNKKTYASTSELTQFYIQAHKSFIDIKQLRKENDFVNKMVTMLEKSLFHNQKMAMYWGLLYSGIFTIVLYIFPVAVLLTGIYMTLKGHFTIGKTIAVYTLVNMTQSPLNGIASNLSSCKSTMILSERLENFIVDESVEQPTQIMTEVNSIDFDCDSFGYTKEKDILQNIHFHLNKGELLCIKGRTGVGKTTIASLLMRFNYLEHGSIKIDGVNIKDYTYDSFYRQVNILNQSPFIFQDTVINNITLGENYPEEFLNEVINVAQIGEFIKEYGKDYELHEDANNISGGQRQRLGLARILIRKPQLLILDEPTAALDENTANNLAIKLKAFSEKYGITIVVITHSSIFENYATQILDLNNNILAK